MRICRLGDHDCNSISMAVFPFRPVRGMVAAGLNGGHVMIRLVTRALALAATLAPAAAQSAIRAGVLECHSAGSTSFVVGSVHEFECMFRSEDGQAYPYHGVVRRMGVDIGVTSESGLSWVVLAPTRLIGPGDLSGSYGGVTAGAAVGVGVTANALVGGSNNTIALQPLSLEGQSGVNVAVGVAELELRYGR